MALTAKQAAGLHEVYELLIEVPGRRVLLALAMGVTLGRTILGRMDTISRTAGESWPAICRSACRSPAA